MKITFLISFIILKKSGGGGRAMKITIFISFIILKKKWGRGGGQ